MLQFFKGQPTDFVIHYRSGKIVRSGPGLAFYYFVYNTQIAAVPTSSADAGFVFNHSGMTIPRSLLRTLIWYYVDA